MMEFLELAKICAPEVHATTLVAVVRHESGFDPLIINVNGKPGRQIRPKSREQATKEAQKLLEQGASFDAGYGQINSRNWEWLGITPETVFDPCTNLRAAQRVLVDCYQRASNHHSGPSALYAAFSCYNTGNFTNGISNGYVGKVLAGAGLKVPALPGASLEDKAPLASAKPAVKPSATSRPPASSPNTPSSEGAFSQRRPDAFAQPRPDAFGLPSAARMHVGSINYLPRPTR